jgi:hypothetical protein
MQLQGMTIALRRRLPWEATDLGIALVRAHIKRILLAWCLVTLPVWLLVNAVGVAINASWVALLVMWWLKPLFDRIPLYAISRSVFGHTPGVGEIVRAQLLWGWREVGPWLLWRRLHPSRLLLLPVDLLERVTGQQRSERVRVLVKGDAGPRNQLVGLGLLFELLLGFGLLTSVFMFVPSEFVSGAGSGLLHYMTENPPAWARLLLNACIWFGTTMVEPFMVGAGFGLYLNRRVQLEAWDVEHAFRRIAARLTRVAQPICLVLMLALAGLTTSHRAEAMQAQPCPSTATDATADAQSAGSNAASPSSACPGAALPGASAAPSTIPALFGTDYRRDSGAFAAHVKHEHDSLVSTVRDWRWELRNPGQHKDFHEPSEPRWIQSISNVIGLLAH